MSLREEKSYWLSCDGGDQTGPCHSALGPARDLRLLFHRAREAGWQTLGEAGNGAAARCRRHRVEEAKT